VVEGIEAEIEVMKTTATIKEPLNVTGNLSACRAYNKLCAYFEKCHGKQEDVHTKAAEDESMEGLDALFSKPKAVEMPNEPRASRQEDCPIIPPDAPIVRTVKERVEDLEEEVRNLRGMVEALASGAALVE
jgi:hypothetical protein